MCDSARSEITLGKTYKETKIGFLPSNWEVVSLEDVTDPCAPIRYGVVQIGPNTPGGVPIVPIKHVRRINNVSLHRASPDIEASYAGSRVRGGDVLLSVKGTIGEVGVVPSGFEGNIAREIARIRPTQACDSDFLAQQLEADHTQRRIDRRVVGSTRLEFSIHAVRDFLIALPPLPEQRKIAEILRTWDEAIEKLEALRAAKESRYKALARRFFDPCHPTFHGRPNAWREFEFGDVFRERSQSGEESDRLLSITMNGGVIDRDDVGRKDTSTEDKSKYKLILPGDIGYNTMRMWQGVSGLSALRGIISPAYTVVTPVDNRIVGRYAAHLFKSRRMIFDFERYSQGLTSDTWNLKFPAFSKIKVFLPPIEDQEKQANLLDAMVSEINVIGRQIDVLSRQKRGLMQKLLTGEWRVVP